MAAFTPAEGADRLAHGVECLTDLPRGLWVHDA